MKSTWYLKRAIFFFAIAIISFHFIGCAPHWITKCRHRAVVTALTAGETHEVRIMTGPARVGAHAQAQAKIDGEWQWLNINGNRVDICDQEPFTPDRAWTVKEFNEKFFYK